MRLIDRDAIHWRPDQNWELYATAADIRAIPTVDAVVVTRCKDCKHYLIADEFDGGKRYMCEVNHFSYLNSDGDMHFCSYGEPREAQNADDHD